MALKPRADKPEFAAVRAEFFKPIKRIYALWLIGLVVGAINLRPQSATLGGLTFTFENAGLVEGIIYLGVCVLYLSMFVEDALTFRLPLRSWGLMRKAIYFFSRPRRTLRGIKGWEIAKIKMQSRGFLFFYRVIGWLYLFIPLAHVLIWKRTVLSNALGAIF